MATEPVFVSPASPAGSRAFAVFRWGAAARRALEAANGGRVLAVFHRSFYAEAPSGGLACLGAPAIGEGPLNVLCVLPEGMDWERSGLRVGAPLRRRGARLLVGARFVFDLGGARQWRPAAMPGGWEPAALCAALAEAARPITPPEGLAPLVAPLAAGEPERAPGGDPLLAAARAGAGPLSAWLRAALRGEEAAVPEAVGGLVGLGPGLTPSGDDFLGGVLVALHSLGRAEVAGRLADWLLPLARERTTRISFAHLACAAEGEGAGALHETLAALAAPDASGLAAALAALAAIGHTSGWDALAGAACALAGACALG